MYITTNKHALDEKYKNTFRKPLNMKDYYLNKKEELQNYRNTWTKKEQSFQTTYNADILSKSGSLIVSKK